MQASRSGSAPIDRLCYALQKIVTNYEIDTRLVASMRYCQVAQFYPRLEQWH